MIDNLKNKPVIIWAIALNVVISFLAFSNPVFMKLLAITPQSFSQPWQLWTHSFVHGNFIHLALNMLVLAQFAPIAIGRYSNKIQGFILFGLPLVVGLLMQVIFVFSPSAAIGYSGVIFAIIGFYLQQRLPGSQSVLIQIVVYHVMVISFDWPVSIAGHAAGFIAGYTLSYYLSRRGQGRSQT